MEDTWRPRNGLTIHAGLRYEYAKLPQPTAPNAALDAVFGAQGATSVFPADRNNLGPRFGAGVLSRSGLARAWCGWGMGLTSGGCRERRSGVRWWIPRCRERRKRIRIAPSAETICPQVGGQGFGYPCSFLAMPGGVVARTASAMVFCEGVSAAGGAAGELQLRTQRRAWGEPERNV